MRIGAQYWLSNILYERDDDTKQLLLLSYICIAMGGAIILHSAFVNRLKYPLIRILVETCALGTLLNGMFYILGTSTHTSPSLHFSCTLCL